MLLTYFRQLPAGTNCFKKIRCLSSGRIDLDHKEGTGTKRPVSFLRSDHVRARKADFTPVNDAEAHVLSFLIFGYGETRNGGDREQSGYADIGLVDIYQKACVAELLPLLIA